MTFGRLATVNLYVRTLGFRILIRPILKYETLKKNKKTLVSHTDKQLEIQSYK